MLRAAGLAAVLALAANAVSAQTAAPPKPRTLDRVPTVTVQAALTAAQPALADCRRRGATVAVAVVDRAGTPLVVLRDGLAGPHTPDTAVRKAWTAVSFRSTTTELVAATAPGGPNGGLRQLPGVAIIGGGIPMQAAGVLVGGIGVSGAPSGELDDACAKAGIGAIGDALELD
ncbi:MAG: heme-binding protein [Burkholderiales bacterium]